MAVFRTILLLQLLLMLPGKTALAEELRLRLGTTFNYTEDLFGRSNSGGSDNFFFRAGPSLTLRDDEGRLKWELGYIPEFEYYLVDGGEAEFSHIARASGSFLLRPRTQVSFTNRFSRQSNLEAFNRESNVEGGEAEQEFGRTSIVDNNFSASLTHRFTARNLATLNFFHNIRRPGDDTRADSSGLGGSFSYRYVVSARDTLGVNGSFRRSKTERLIGNTDAETDFYNISATLSHDFDPTFGITLSAGPTFVDSADSGSQEAATGNLSVNVDGQLVSFNSASCAQTPQVVAVLPDGSFIYDVNSLDGCLLGAESGQDNSTLTYFANVQVRKRWERWNGNLSYRRQASEAAGFGSNRISDIVSGSLDWTPGARWRVGFSASWQRTKSALDQSVRALGVSTGEGGKNEPPRLVINTADAGGQTGFKTWILAANADYTLRRGLKISGRVSYRDQKSENDLGSSTDFNRWTARIGMSYDFDPIRF